MAGLVKLEIVGPKSGLLEGGLANHELLSKAVRTAARAIEAEAKQAILNGPKTGRIYHGEQQVEFTTKAGEEVSFTAYAGETGHQASAPGEAPASDEGHLVNSIAVRMKSDLEAEITVSAEYAAVLEYGGDQIAARPFLAPAVQASAPAFLAEVEKVAKG